MAQWQSIWGICQKFPIMCPWNLSQVIMEHWNQRAITLYSSLTWWTFMLDALQRKTNARINHIHMCKWSSSRGTSYQQRPIGQRKQEAVWSVFQKKIIFFGPAILVGSGPFTIKNIKTIKKKYIEIKEIYKNIAKTLPLQPGCMLIISLCILISYEWTICSLRLWPMLNVRFERFQLLDHWHTCIIIDLCY